MIIRALRAIRKKPKPVRDQYAFWIAGVCTALVAVVWLQGRSGLISESLVPTANVASVSSFSDAIQEVGSAASDISGATKEAWGTQTNPTQPTNQSQSEITIDPDFIQSLIAQPTPTTTTTTAPPTTANIVRIATTSSVSQE